MQAIRASAIAFIAAALTTPASSSAMPASSARDVAAPVTPGQADLVFEVPIQTSLTNYTSFIRTTLNGNLASPASVSSQVDHTWNSNSIGADYHTKYSADRRAIATGGSQVGNELSMRMDNSIFQPQCIAK
ncbi:hypothetical protein CF326_g3257 [Tilletia indica]|nr:hypothetical protein CF326_g3257 [Tilletia indica]